MINYIKKVGLILVMILLSELLFIEIGIASDYAYLFSWDAKFLKIDAENDKIVDIGNLWWLKIFNVGPVQTDTERKLIFINTERAFLQGLDKPPYSGIMILGVDHKGNLKFMNRFNIGIEKVETSGIIGPHISGLGFNPDGKKIYASWGDDEKEGIVGIFDAKTYNKLFEIPKNWAGVEKCFTTDGKRMIVPWGREFLIYDTEKYNVIGRINYYEKVGIQRFFSKAITSIADCKAAIIEYKERPESTEAAAKVYVYDLEKEKVISQIDVNFKGEYRLAKKGEQLWIDEIEDVPVVKDGRVIEIQPKKVGKIHIYDVQSGEKRKVLNMPPEGKRYWISPDNKKLYYLGNQLLTIVELQEFKVLKILEVPFENAYMVFLNE